MKRVKQLIVAVIIIMTCSISFAINFNSIFDYPPFVSWVVEGNETQPINFTKGETTLMYFCATAPCNISTFKIIIETTIMGVTVEVPLPYEGKYYLHNCELPLESGDVLYVQLPIEILPSAPFISGTFTVKFMNENYTYIAGGSCSFNIYE
ncbi:MULTISPECIES: hypothetical protein [Butyricimonas]|uniref:hypothetical protein n=1 Tax=Butyricimonas TaxID=574697 RepID=UPI000C0875A7|nr:MULTISPECIES: hypothetical protein [Butyricimonas]MCB6972084.1 hypothetical protein [Butyricimonas synergistica]MCG4519092.1 hypothetical protein [Butyricimonas sp. DFI.6.44]